MANVVAISEINNGPRNYSFTVNIVGDGSNQLTHEPLLDAGLLGIDTVSIWRVTGHASGFDMILEWGGTTNAVAMEIPDGIELDYDFSRIGGLKNPRVANYSGDLCLTTVGMAAGEEAFLLLECKKKSGVTVVTA